MRTAGCFVLVVALLFPSVDCHADEASLHQFMQNLGEEQVDEDILLLERGVPLTPKQRAALRSYYLTYSYPQLTDSEGNTIPPEKDILGEKLYPTLKQWMEQREWRLRNKLLEEYTSFIATNLGLDIEKRHQFRLLFNQLEPWTFETQGEPTPESIVQVIQKHFALGQGNVTLLRNSLESENWAELRKESLIREVLGLSKDQEGRLGVLDKQIDEEMKQSDLRWETEMRAWSECPGTVYPPGRDRFRRKHIQATLRLTKEQLERYLDLQAGLLPHGFGFTSVQQQQDFIQIHNNPRLFTTYAEVFGPAPSKQMPFGDPRPHYNVAQSPPPEVEGEPQAGSDLSLFAMFGNLSPPGQTQDEVEQRNKNLSRNKLNILYLWSASCSPCQKELGELELLYQALKTQGLGIIAMNMDSVNDHEKARGIVSAERLTYQVLEDSGRNFYGSVAIRGYSRTFFLTPKGQVMKFSDPKTKATITRVVGPRPWSSPEYKRAVTELLGARPTP